MELSRSVPNECTVEVGESAEEGVDRSPAPPVAGSACPLESSADEKLIRECLSGNEEAWSTLVDKYRRLIFSIPIKYGFSRDDAAESVSTSLFQNVVRIGALATTADLTSMADQGDDS
jgi:hypothetical protein